MPNILIVEDDPLTIDCLVDLLEAEDFQVTSAIDGDIAQKLVTQQDFDVIVCDLLLSRVHGYEFLSYLRKNTRTADIPFIVLTGKSSTKDINLGKEMGVDDYLVKPFLNQELITSIKTQLEKKQFLEKCYQTEIQNFDTTLKEFTQNSNLDSQDNFIPERDSEANLAYQSRLIDKQYKLLCKYIIERVESDSENSANTFGTIIGCIRLDNLKEIKANYPKHSAAIVKQAAQRLLNSIGHQANIKCLPNGDFAVTIPYIKSLHQALKIIRTGQDSLFQSLIIDSNIINLKSYVGISFYPKRFEEINLLLERAQQLVKEAQKNQNDYYEVYSDTLKTLKLKSLILIEELQDALLKNQLNANYQPQIDLLTGKVIGYEALLFWNHPRKGNISAEKFITIAEDSGLIESIETKFMFDECRKLKKWHNKGWNQLKLTINISNSQFHRDGFISLVKKILKEIQLKPQFLTISLTESTLLENKKQSFTSLSELKSLGVGVILNDFEINFYSLSYLTQFPFTIVNFDISPLNSLLKISDSQKILKYIATLAKQFELQLLVKGVETLQQFNLLRQHHFEIVLGNYLVPPLEKDGFEYLLSGKSDWLTILFRLPPT